MNIHNFSFPEMYSNSKGKTSLSLVCAHTLILTGCTMGIKGAFIANSECMLQGLAFSSLGCGLLGIRRFTPDKEVSPNAEANEKVS